MPALCRLLYADDHGELFSHPYLKACASDGQAIKPLAIDDTVPLPGGARLVMLPGRTPAAWDPGARRLVNLDEAPASDGRVIRPNAVGAIVVPAQLRMLHPAYQRQAGAPPLPLFAYAAAGDTNRGFAAAARRTDPRSHWDARHFVIPGLPRRIAARQAKFPANAVYRQLAQCATAYNCCTACNIFMERWEGALPLSPACNARCHGCISEQQHGYTQAAQPRIVSAPPVSDVVETAVEHLRGHPGHLVSFGQGCEGEPTLLADELLEATRQIKKAVPEAAVNLNTNGSRPRVIAESLAAGLTQIRVSINSAREDNYLKYYRPEGYSFADVRESLSTAVRGGLRTSLNLLVFPGVTDRPGELEALLDLLLETRPQMLQFRNLGIDPEEYLSLLPGGEQPLGLRRWLDEIEQACPDLLLGNFNLLPGQEDLLRRRKDQPPAAN